MATLENWTKYLTALHELALIEDDLRVAAKSDTFYDAHILAKDLLFTRF
jgi:hypothetical protein